MMRYVRAFFGALKMTLRGERIQSPAERTFPRFFAWLTEAQRRVAAAYQQADAAGFDKAGRKALTVKIDGRDMSAETILGGVRHHLEREYVFLLEDYHAHSLTSIYASNLNDRYWLMRLVDAPELPEGVRAALVELQAHLDAIPPSNEVGAP